MAAGPLQLVSGLAEPLLAHKLPATSETDNDTSISPSNDADAYGQNV
jgi:hypothetical protein